MEYEKLLDSGYWKDTFDEIVRRNITFNKKAQIALLEDLVSQLESGVPVLESFNLFIKNYDNGIRDVSQSVVKAQNEGRSLASGLKGWFPDEILAGIRVGEDRGVLVPTLKNIVAYLQTSSKGIGLFFAKAVYPLIITLMAFVMAHFVVTGFYEVVLSMKDMSEWPTDAAFLYQFWSFLLTFWPLLIVLFVVAYLVIAQALSSQVGTLRNSLDSWPIFKQYRLQQGSIFLTTLGLMLQNGASLHEGLNELEKGATAYMRYHLRRMRQRVSTGIGNEGDYLNTGMLEKQTINRLKTLADVNDFEVAMVRLGEQTMHQTGKLLESASEVFKYIGIAISGSLVASVFVGAFSLANSLG